MSGSYTVVDARVDVLRRWGEEENESEEMIATSGDGCVDLHASFYDRDPDAPAFSASRVGREVPMMSLYVAVGDVNVHIELDLLAACARLGAGRDAAKPDHISAAERGRAA